MKKMQVKMQVYKNKILFQPIVQAKKRIIVNS